MFYMFGLILKHFDVFVVVVVSFLKLDCLDDALTLLEEASFTSFSYSLEG